MPRCTVYVRCAVKNLLQRSSVATLSSLRSTSIFLYASAVVAVVLSAEEVKNSLVKFISQATVTTSSASASSHRSVSLTYLFFYSGDKLKKIFASAGVILLTVFCRGVSAFTDILRIYVGLVV